MATSTPINIEYDGDQSKPIIRFLLATPKELKCLRSILGALAEGQMENVDLNRDSRFIVSPGLELRLERSDQLLRHAAAISRINSVAGIAAFLWKRSKEQWEDDLFLLEGLEAGSGHHYLTGEEADEAEIVVSYRE